MKLTGQCKEDFSYKYNMSNFNEYSEVLQNALIIEFFDSVGIYIDVNLANDNQFCYNIISYKLNISYSSLENNLKRQEATEQAIIHANKIYNEKMP